MELQLREVQIQEQSLQYYRPSQIRKVPLKSSSNRGFIPVLKPNLRGLVLEYESQLEHDFLLLLDHDPNCIDFQSQAIKVSYKTAKGTKTTAFPDVWAIFNDGKQYVFEVKSEKKLQELQKTENWHTKVTAIREECDKHGWIFQIVTEEKIRCQRLYNIKDCIVAAKHYSINQLGHEDLGNNFISMIESTLSEDRYSLRQVAELISPHLSLSFGDVVSVLKNRIYYGLISIDWDKELYQTQLLPHSTSIKPVYALPMAVRRDENGSRILDIDEDNLSEDKIISNWLNDSQFILIESLTKEYGTKASRKQILEFSKQQKREFPVINAYYTRWKNQQKYEERFNFIKPLIEKFAKDNQAKKPAIFTYCQEQLNMNAKETLKAYRLYLKWKRDGLAGLLVKSEKQQRNSKFSEQVEILLEEALREWNNNVHQQAASAYDRFLNRCKDYDIPEDEVPHQATFYRRIEKIHAVEDIGKKFPIKKHLTLSRGLTGKYGEGRHPGTLIQVDHTMADIWVVDEFTRKAYCRPWITLAIDIFSRSVWGIFVSAEAPSQESVSQCIISGLVPKHWLHDYKLYEGRLLKDGIDPAQFQWVSSGAPGRIQVDNGKDFMANSIKNICMKLNITLEFRPIKTPEYGGFVESIWDKINDRIRGDMLPGRVYPIDKFRKAIKSKRKYTKPRDYNPQKDAALTMTEFREWFFAYVLTILSSKKRAQQAHTPNQLWIDGISGKHLQPLGGQLKIFENQQQWDFVEIDSKPEESAVLSERGLRYENIYYNESWFINLRLQRLLKDGQKITFKYSNWDRRYIWYKDPTTKEYKSIKAYNYAKDDRIHDLLMRGLGERGSKEFRVPKKLINLAEDMLKETSLDDKDAAYVMYTISEKLTKRKKLTKKEQKFAKMTKLPTQPLQISDNPESKIAETVEESSGVYKATSEDNNVNSLEASEADTQERKKKIVPSPTSWEEAQKRLKLGRFQKINYYKDEEEEKE